MSTRSRGSASSPRAGGRNQASAGTPATGKPAATGTQVTNLSRQETSDEVYRQRELNQVNRERLNDTYNYNQRMDQNIYAPGQKRELASEERKTDRNASAQERAAAMQAQANMYAAQQQAAASKYGSKQSAEAQKFGAAEGTKQAEKQARAQMFAANVDAAARQFDTKTKGRTEFSGLLANLAASVGNRSGQSMSDIFAAATQAAGVASQNKDSDKDRMADMYKSIMATYNTGSSQFKYW